MTINSSPWKLSNPDAVGLYIASTERRADYVRCWTGKHWTAPLHVRDLTLTDRIPNPDGPPAATHGKHAIEWLEAVALRTDGWITWGGLLDAPPVTPDVRVRAKFRGGGESIPVEASALRWGAGAERPFDDVVAYRVEPSATSEPLPVRRATDAKPTNPKDLCGVRKAPMSTVSAAVLAEVGVAMLEGASKYGRHNYRAVGVRSSVYYDGTMRHLMAWWEGQDIDPDSGMSHITKAITSLVVLRDAMIQGKCTDDRAPRSADFYEGLNALAGQIIDRYADKNPRHYTIADEVRDAA